MKACILIAATAAALITATAANASEYSKRQSFAGGDDRLPAPNPYRDEADGDRSWARTEAHIREIERSAMSQARLAERMEKRIALSQSRSALLEVAAREGRPLSRAEQASLNAMTKQLANMNRGFD